MDNRHEEILLRMKTMDRLLDDTVDELLYGVDVLDATCYTLRMYAEWMMGTVGPTSKIYPDFERFKDSFLTFEVLLTLDDRDVDEYVIKNLYSQVQEFRKIVGELIVELEEVM